MSLMGSSGFVHVNNFNPWNMRWIKWKVDERGLGKMSKISFVHKTIWRPLVLCERCDGAAQFYQKREAIDCQINFKFPQLIEFLAAPKVINCNFSGKACLWESTTPSFSLSKQATQFERTQKLFLCLVKLDFLNITRGSLLWYCLLEKFPCCSLDFLFRESICFEKNRLAAAVNFIKSEEQLSAN